MIQVDCFAVLGAYYLVSYSVALCIPPGRTEGSVPGWSSGSVEFPQGALGGRQESPGGSLNQGELEREIQDELERGIPGVPGRPRGVPGGRWEGPWRVLGVPWESLGFIGGSLGVARRVPGRHQGVLGEDRGGTENTIVFCLGCLGEVQGLPWGDFGRRGGAWGPTWTVDMLIFHWI